MRGVLVGWILILLSVHQAHASAYFEVKKGLKNHEAHDYGAAIGAFANALDHAPKHPQIMANLANSYANQGDFKAAQSLFEKARNHGLESAEIAYQIGTVAAMNQEFEVAKTNLESALAQNPKDLDAKINLEWVLTQMQNQQSQNPNEQSESGKDNREATNEPQESTKSNGVDPSTALRFLDQKEEKARQRYIDRKSQQQGAETETVVKEDW